MPHVMMVTTSYPQGLSGSEAAGSFVADFALQLSQHVRVTVLAAGIDDSVWSEDQLTVRYFAVPRLPLSLLNPLQPTDWWAIMGSLQSGHVALSRSVQADKPDHIFALWALLSGHWADRVGGRHGVPYSIWALGSDIWGMSRLPFVRRRLRSVLRRAAHRYADGIALGKDVEALAGASCQFLPSSRKLPKPAVSTVAHGPPYKLAFLGRWHKNKGIDLLLDALALLRDDDWSKISEVRINGGGPMEADVSEAAGALVAMGRPVVLGGYLDKQAAADLIGWTDYLLLPSRIESIPVIFSDAVQLATPIVATPVGDLPRLHDAHCFGVLARGASSAAFADALRAALRETPSAYQLGLEKAYTSFDLATVAARFVADISSDTV